MSEELEPVPPGTKLEHAIAQAKADIESINVKCGDLKKQAEALRKEQVEIEELLLRLEVG